MGWTELTAERIAAMAADEAGALYPAVRDRLHEDYQECGPTAARRAYREAESLRVRAVGFAVALAPRRAELAASRAGEVIEEFEARRGAYERHAHLKTMLAIRAGNLDWALPYRGLPYSPGRDDLRAEVESVVAARRRELGITDLIDRPAYDRAAASRELALRHSTPGKALRTDLGTLSHLTVVELRAEAGTAVCRTNSGAVHEYSIHDGRRVDRAGAA